MMVFGWDLEDDGTLGCDATFSTEVHYVRTDRAKVLSCFVHYVAYLAIHTC